MDPTLKMSLIYTTYTLHPEISVCVLKMKNFNNVNVKFSFSVFYFLLSVKLEMIIMG